MGGKDLDLSGAGSGVPTLVRNDDSRGVPRTSAGEANRASVGRVNWVAVLLPTVAICLFEFSRHQLLASVLPAWLGYGWLGNVLAALVVGGIVYGFVRVFAQKIGEAAAEVVRAREEVAVVVERQRIAREMHDGVAQTLFYLSVSLREAGTLVESGEKGEALGELRAAEGHLKEAHRKVRAAIADLKRQATVEDFGESLRHAASLVGDRLGMRVGCEIEGGLAVPPSSRGHLLAVIQEALTNARRHGGAKEALVRAGVAGRGLVVEVADGGSGFDTNSVPENGHHGLAIMRERARMIGGELRLSSIPGRGARVTVYVPGGGT